MSKIVSDQIRSNDAYVRQFQSSWRYAVVLERVAWGGGTTYWYIGRNREELSEIIDQLRGGSCVSFYFDEKMHVEVDSEEARRRMFDAVGMDREIVLGYPADRLAFSVELPTGSSELSEALLSHMPGEFVIWGAWPSRDGGPGTLTLDLVDEDGILRQHPH